MLSHLIERRDTIGGIAALSNWFREVLGRETAAGVPVSDYTALNHSAVWTGIDFISSTLGMLPVKLMQDEDNLAGTSRVHSGPKANLLRRRPNDRQNAVTFKSVLQARAVFHGNGYAWIERTPEGRAVALWPLPSRATEPVIEEGALLYRTLVAGRPVFFPAANVIHVPGLMLDEQGLKGLSFLEYARHVIGLGLAAQEFGGQFFGSGASPRFIVSHPDTLAPEAAQRLANQLNTVYGGRSGAHKWAVIDEGMRTEKLSFNPEEAQFLDTRKDNRVEIAGMLRVPPQVLGIYDRATYRNAEHMDLFVVKYTLSSWIAKWEAELDNKLLTAQDRTNGQHFKFNVNALLRGDTRTRAELYQVMLQHSVMTPNEVRGKEDLPAIDGLDEPLPPHNAGAGFQFDGEDPDEGDDDD
ncbi:phage portal protein [Thioalkalivibrio sp.]|uniref:phage portal protein n=1 Tax=Thioalkalivibrio sp. TaxID=2093813 RepID=UPI00356ACF52